MACQQTPDREFDSFVVMAGSSMIDREDKTSHEKEDVLTRKNTAKKMPRVFVADDRKEVLQAVVQVLEGEFKVVGTAEDGMTVLKSVPFFDADILILDISMPVLNGIEVALQLQSARSQAKIVFLTVHEDGDFVRAAMSAGAFGYVLKSYLASDLVPAIRKALKDCTFVSPAIHMV